MSRPIKDRTGNRYGRLTARYVAAQNLNKQAMWYCDCDCGGNTVAEGSKLERGDISSCGCYRADVRRARPLRDLSKRFWEKVAIPPDPEDCWLWTAARDPNTGYGRMGLGGRSSGTRGAHQVAFELWHGPIPAGREACHRCNNRWCVNPTHLVAGTRSDNVNHRYLNNKPRRSWWNG